MTNKRFPVAGTSPPLTVPWEVAATVVFARVYHDIGKHLTRQKARGGFTEDELDSWYGKHWREVAE